MTGSIIARGASGASGIVIASKFFAVGALCPHARSRVGTLCKQALVNRCMPRRRLSSTS